MNYEKNLQEILMSLDLGFLFSFAIRLSIWYSIEHNIEALNECRRMLENILIWL